MIEEIAAHPDLAYEIGRQRRREVVVMSAERYDALVEREDALRDLAWAVFADERLTHPTSGPVSWDEAQRRRRGRRRGCVARIVVEFLDDEAFDSVERLPDPHRDVAWDLLDHLREAPYYGKPLDANVATGDLSDARSLYVIDFERKAIDWPPPYRIVYRLLPFDAAPEKAQVIWAGERDDLRVYRTAARRLGR